MVYGIKDDSPVPTCPACGCRLVYAGDGYLSHMIWGEKDARGCKCALLYTYFKSDNFSLAALM